MNKELLIGRSFKIITAPLTEKKLKNSTSLTKTRKWSLVEATGNKKLEVGSEWLCKKTEVHLSSFLSQARISGIQEEMRHNSSAESWHNDECYTGLH